MTNISIVIPWVTNIIVWAQHVCSSVTWTSIFFHHRYVTHLTNNKTRWPYNSLSNKHKLLKCLIQAKDLTFISKCDKLLVQNIWACITHFSLMIAYVILMHFVLHATLWNSTKEHAGMFLLNTGLRTYLKYIYFNRTNDQFQISLTFQNCRLSPTNCKVILEWWTDFDRGVLVLFDINTWQGRYIML